MVLRSFLYLNISMMTDFLSQLEGSVVEAIDEVESEQKDRGGKLTAKVVEGSVESQKSIEIRQQRLVTDAARFQRLYGLAEAEIQPLSAFDKDIWNQIKRGELLEVEASIRIPKWLALSKTFSDVLPLLDFVQAFQETPSDSDLRANLEGWSTTIGRELDEKPVPLLFEAALTPGVRFAAHLQRKYLRCELSDLQGEATVLGKVLSIVPPGKEVEVFKLVPALSEMLSETRDRNKRARIRLEMTSKGFLEVVKGPGFVLLPLAVYL